MKTKIVIVILLTLGVIIGSKLILKKEMPRPEIKTEEIENSLSPKTNSEGSVDITVTPDISSTSDLWNFTIVFDTHSVELDQDLTQVVVLYDDKGNEYKPLAWTGTPAGGHHREGSLSFNPIELSPQNLTLTIKDVGEIPERRFFWDIRR